MKKMTEEEELLNNCQGKKKIHKFGSLPQDCLQIIFSYLPVKELILHVSRISKGFHEFLSDPQSDIAIYSNSTKKDFNCKDTISPSDDWLSNRFLENNPLIFHAQSWKDCWRRWRILESRSWPSEEYLGKLDAQLMLRSARAWETIHSITPDLNSKLSLPATRQSWDSYLISLKSKDAGNSNIRFAKENLRGRVAILAVHSNQNLRELGVFGMYEVYDLSPSIKLFGLNMRSANRGLQQLYRNNIFSKVDQFAGTTENRNHEPIIDYSIRVLCDNRFDPEEEDSAMYSYGIRLLFPSFKEIGGGACLKWIERYADGVRNQHLTRFPRSHPKGLGLINLIPFSGPYTVRSISRGVEIVLGYRVCFENHHAVVVYQLSIRLDPTITNAEERGYETCQLRSRHWEIESMDRQISRVDGEAVIGKTPIFKKDYFLDHTVTNKYQQGWFQYCSCCGPSIMMLLQIRDHQQNFLGSFQGEIEFVPGTIEKPTNVPFRVRIPKIEFYLSSILG